MVALLGILASSDSSKSSIKYEKKITLSFEEGMTRSEYQELASEIKTNEGVRKVKVDHENNEIIVTLDGDENADSEALISKTSSDKSIPISDVELENRIFSESESGYDNDDENEGESFNITDLDFFSIFRNPLQQ